jgi:diaminopimelate epimerase
MKFTKMHGAGNDYVYVNCFEESVANPSEVAIMVSNRNFGIGSDGLILIMPSDAADVRMRMFNSDGSESEMCGNGIRCVAKYAFDHGIVTKKEITAETGAGILTLQLFTSTWENPASPKRRSRCWVIRRTARPSGSRSTYSIRPST